MPPHKCHLLISFIYIKQCYQKIPDGDRTTNRTRFWWLPTFLSLNSTCGFLSSESAKHTNFIFFLICRRHLKLEIANLTYFIQSSLRKKGSKLEEKVLSLCYVASGGVKEIQNSKQCNTKTELFSLKKRYLALFSCYSQPHRIFKNEVLTILHWETKVEEERYNKDFTFFPADMQSTVYKKGILQIIGEYCHFFESFASTL